MSPAAAAASPWTGLPSDLLIEVAGRLHDAVDVVRFHAVCRPWRDTAALLAPAATHPVCLPWVLGTRDGVLVHSVVNFRCSFQTRAYRHSHDVVLEKPRRASGINDTNWVATVDGTAAWLFVALPRLRPRLINHLTGAVVRLPRLPDDAEIRRPCENFRGIRYGDGTVFLYKFDSEIRGSPSTPDFIAATLRPGHAAWTVVKKRLNLAAAAVQHACAAYLGGKILVCAGGHFSWVLTPDTEARGGGNGGTLVSWLEPSKDTYYSRVRDYVLVFGGELLRASVMVVDQSFGLSVTLHALQEEPGGGGKMRWVARDSRSLDNRVLFLGTSASFATTQLDSGTACAYLVFGCSVFRYSFGNGDTKLLKSLGPEWANYESIMWLRPSPSVAPIEKIRERLEAHTKKYE